MDKTWLPTLFETCPGGVSSAVTPELLPPGQFAWGFNVAMRGAKPHTRPPFIERVCGLPRGLHQGSSYFGIQGGMIIVSIAGQIYRVRIGVNNYSSEPIPLGFNNSGILKQVWMQQTIESLVIQDGQSNAILYDGSTARRAAADEVPRGRVMAYGNGRLWVAINANELVAGDIRTRTPGSELKFTETQYLTGGGALFFPRGITGMDFIPVTGAADFGTLIIGGKDYLESIRADVTTRDQWGMPGFITNVFRDVGFAGDWSIVQVNQDLYWRDADGGIRSLANNLSTNNSPGSTPISCEVSRLVDFDTDQLLPFCSAIYFDNRLLMTSSPYLNASGGVSFKDLVSLDFSPISTMQLKAPPAYDGQWTGIPGVCQLITGEFDGKKRAFAISSDEEGVNRLWEIMKSGRADVAITCGSGILMDSPIQSFVEYPAAAFGLRALRKRLERCDVWVSGVVGQLELVAYWRSDNTQKWTEWDRVDTCAKTEDASTVTPHVWKNLLPQQRTQIKTFTIPEGLNEVTRYFLQIGFNFQIRLAWLGKCQIEKVVIYASPVDDPDYAERDTLLTECIENNVTGNRIAYSIPTASGYLVLTGFDFGAGQPWEISGVEGGPFTPASITFTLQNLSSEPIDFAIAISVAWLAPGFSSGTLAPGQSLDLTITVDADALPAQIEPYTGTISFSNQTNGCVSPSQAQDIDVSLQVVSPPGILFEGRSAAGTATICGWDELTTPSTPPKKYRYCTFGGVLHGDSYTGIMGCNDKVGEFDIEFSGAAVISGDTCLPIAAGNKAIIVDGGSPVNETMGSPTIFGASDCFHDVTLTPIFSSRLGTGDCCQSGPNNSQIHTGANFQTLTVEDTENDALLRLFPTLTWSAWGTETQVDSGYENRISGFSFDYLRGQWRALITGLVAGQSYTFTLDIWQRDYGTGPYIPAGTVSVPFTADGSGEYLIAATEVPNPAGKETYVTNPAVT